MNSKLIQSCSSGLKGFWSGLETNTPKVAQKSETRADKGAFIRRSLGSDALTIPVPIKPDHYLLLTKVIQ